MLAHPGQKADYAPVHCGLLFLLIGAIAIAIAIVANFNININHLLVIKWNSIVNYTVVLMSDCNTNGIFLIVLFKVYT